MTFTNCLHVYLDSLGEVAVASRRGTHRIFYITVLQRRPPNHNSGILIHTLTSQWENLAALYRMCAPSFQERRKLSSPEQRQGKAWHFSGLQKICDALVVLTSALQKSACD